MRKIITTIGARPQFIKAALVSKALEGRGVNEPILYTGQHFHSNMSDVFFDELDTPRPAFNLGIGGGAYGKNTESVELAETGWNKVVAPFNVDVLTKAIVATRSQGNSIQPYGKGRAAELVINKSADK